MQFTSHQGVRLLTCEQAAGACAFHRETQTVVLRIAGASSACGVDAPSCSLSARLSPRLLLRAHSSPERPAICGGREPLL